jgi:hypothetical protein
MAALSKMVANYNSRRCDWAVGKGEEMLVVEETSAEVKRIQKRLIDAEGLAKKFNSREILFGVPQTDYSDVARTAKAFEPYAALWNTMNDFDKKRNIWLTDPFTNLDPEEVEKSVQTWWRTVFKVGKTFESTQPEVFAMASLVKEDLEQFKTNVPIITALRNPGMRDRHWETLSAEINMQFPFDDSVTLDKVLTFIDLCTYCTRQAAAIKAAGWHVHRSVQLASLCWAVQRRRRDPLSQSTHKGSGGGSSCCGLLSKTKLVRGCWKSDGGEVRARSRGGPVNRETQKLAVHAGWIIRGCVTMCL